MLDVLPAAAAGARRLATPLGSAVLGLILDLLSSAQVMAVESEIHVYDDSIATPGSFNLTVHNYYIASGERAAPYGGAIVPDRSLTGGPEWTYGVLPWLECSAYFPIVSHMRNGTTTLDGAELRALIMPQGASDQRHFFYGVNLALDFNNRALSEYARSGELRPIVGAHWGALTVAVNPSLLTGFEGSSSLEFAPSERAAYEVAPLWTIAVEHYSELGPVRKLRAFSATPQVLFAVAEHSFRAMAIEVGAGWGLTRASDPLTLKLVMSFDLP